MEHYWHRNRLILSVAMGIPLCAMTSTGSAETAIEEQTVLDDSAFTSPRAAALGGSISSLADDIDAIWQNPAGIGGFGMGKSTKAPLVRKLYFPHILVGANSATYSLNRTFRDEDAADDPSVAKTLLAAVEGERQYFRNTLSAGAVLGRLMILPYHDSQLAAVPTGDSNTAISMAYRTRSGTAIGFSLTDPKGLVSVGFSRNSFTQTDVSGNTTYDTLITKTDRDAFLSENEQAFTATDDTVGVLWRTGERMAPTLGMTIHHFNKTRFSSKTPDVDSFSVSEDLSLGFSMVPKEQGRYRLAVCIEADKLLQKNVTLGKKIHTGVELTFGSMPGSYATAALRAGWEYAGPSFGLFLNGGLVNLEISSRAEDIGAGNKRIIERRLNGSLFVNVSEF